MPATWAAVSSVFGRFAELVPGFDPQTFLDVGGGTGAALWAAADRFPSLSRATVLDQVDDALRLGRRLATEAAAEAVRSASWRRATVTDPAPLGGADLVAVSYVLSELSQADQAALVERAAEGTEVIAVIEPGTPDGYRRVLAARQILIDAGLTVIAPCPHQRRCPLAGSADWCHFSARVNRSALHRRLKGGELGYEDEKFSYVVAARTAHDQAPGRILRHPLKRKGLVTMQVCEPDAGCRGHPGRQTARPDVSAGQRCGVGRRLATGPRRSRGANPLIPAAVLSPARHHRSHGRAA